MALQCATLGLLPIGDEFLGIDLGDDRLDYRAALIAEALANSPSLSLPQIAGDAGQLEAVYRFFNNERVSPEDLLSPHVEASIERAVAAGEEILAISDTSAMKAVAGTDARKFGKLSTGKAGFYAHLCLLVGLTSGRVFGICDAETWRRTRAKRPSRRMSGQTLAKIPDRESLRWTRQSLKIVEQLKTRGADAICVMDREADSYDVLLGVPRFVIRARNDRVARKVCGDQWSRVSQLTNNLKLVVQRDVEISRRSPLRAPAARKAHPERKARQAKLGIAGVSAEIRCPTYLKGPKSLAVNFVVVREIGAPSDCDPVSWLLITREPIGTSDQLLRIVDAYRRRWLIEEMFKAIKTGCAYRTRQFETYEAMERLLAMTIPVAWRLLAVRSLEREEPDTPASVILTAPEINALRHRANRPIPDAPTVKDVLNAVAGIGGHLKNNGPPGWQILYRGWVEFMSFAAGWKAGIVAQENARLEGKM